MATFKKEAAKSTETLVCMDQASQRRSPKESSHDFHLCKERFALVTQQNFTCVPEKGKIPDPNYLYG
jgi:hypothetical protein